MTDYTALVLAAQRPGEANPLALAHGVSHKCLVPIDGRPLIAHVLHTLSTMAGTREIRISVEAEAVPAIRAVIAAQGIKGAPIRFINSAPSLADSVFAATQGVDGPIMITTADNVLLSHQALRAMLDALERGVEVAAAMTTRAAVLAAHPEGQRRFYEFADDAYSNCNLYAIAGQRALNAAEIFREGGQFAKNPRRIIKAFGLMNLLLARFRLVSLARALERVSKRFGLRFEAIVLADGAHAIDVDNDRTYRIAELLLAQRAMKRAA